MSYEKKFPDWEKRVREAATTTLSATAAATKLGIKYTTYKKYAIKYDCLVTNPSGRGISKKSGTGIPLEDILDGLHPQYQSNKLRLRLLKEEYFEHKCSNCNLEKWLGEPIPLELNHINGVNSNHLPQNLELLCPNCHSLTPTYRGRNKGLTS